MTGSPSTASSTSPGANARAIGRRAAGDLGRDDAGAALDPQHAVLDFVAGRALDDVGDAHREQQQRRGDRQDRPRPLAPTGGCADADERVSGVEHQTRRRRNCKLSKRHTTDAVVHRP